MIKWLLILLFPVASFGQKVIYQSSVFALPDSLLSKIGCGFLTGDLVDNTDPCHPITGLTGTHTLLGNADVDLNISAFRFISPSYPSGVLKVASGQAYLGDWDESVNGTSVNVNDVASFINYIANNGHNFTGILKLNTVNSGALTDSLLTWNASTNIVNKIPISSLPHGTVTSVATGLGLSGGTITTSGTLLVDTASASILSRQRAAATYAPISINGTVTSVSVTTANGVSGTVATATTTPAISLTLGAITPTTVNGNTFTTGSSTYTGVAGQTYTFPTTTGNIGKIAKFASVSGSDVTTTLATAVDITGLSLAVEANKTYKVVAVFWTGCDNTGGLRFAINGPSGSVLKSGILCGTTATAASNVIRPGAIGVLSPGTTSAFNRLNSPGGLVSLIAYVSISSTAGNIQLQFASTTATQTSTIFIGSTMDLIEVQ